MADWTGILKEITEEEISNPLDSVRKKYIKQLHKQTGRNVICYYSGFLDIHTNPDVSINDSDMSGFMTAIHNMDKSKGLDLILHTPGGEVTATEAIGNYLRKVFGNDIRVIVPQMSMSGGTMLACISKEIIMGKHSSIGPIDPQIGGVPAYGVIQEFENAKNEITRNPAAMPLWQIIISKYHPTFIGQCYKAIELSTELIKQWLLQGDMFKNEQDKETKVNTILNFLNNNEYTKIHSRHIDNEKAKSIGLKIVDLEEDEKLQDAVLSIHHCYMHTFSNSNAVKIIESNTGATTVRIGKK